MNPTIMDGDRILVNKRLYKSKSPDRGDIIVFRMGIKMVVKRIIGLPGDVVAIRDGILFRNGEVIGHEGRDHSGLNLTRWSYGPRSVEKRHVFVMGDNKFLSMDSRDFGTIPYNDIIGKAVFTYYPLKRFGMLKNTGSLVRPFKENEI